MDQKERIKTSQFLKEIIEEGYFLGLSKKNTVQRAIKITKDYTGHDFSQDTTIDITSVDWLENIDVEALILEGIKAVRNAKRKPTMKSILERRKGLRKVPATEFNAIIKDLSDEGRITVDSSGRRTAYYLADEK